MHHQKVQFRSPVWCKNIESRFTVNSQHSRQHQHWLCEADFFMGEQNNFIQFTPHTQMQSGWRKLDSLRWLLSFNYITLKLVWFGALFTHKLWLLCHMLLPRIIVKIKIKIESEMWHPIVMYFTIWSWFL